MDAAAEDAAESLRRLVGAARARNGRLAVDWISRDQKPRWRMVRLDGVWYDRDALRALLDRRPPPPAVPFSRRALTAAELRTVRNDNPWALAP